jgi:hypothetical protein
MHLISSQKYSRYRSVPVTYSRSSVPVPYVLLYKFFNPEEFFFCKKTISEIKKLKFKKLIRAN